MRILITAGPTYEPMDPVRFIGNRSTGKMGYSIARAAINAGHQVVLVSGPTNLRAPKGITTHSVMTAKEMLQVVNKHFDQMDAFVFAAAVSDFRPAKYSTEKIKKTASALTIKLVPNPDIAKSIGLKKGPRISVGFALETSNYVKNAQAKMKNKKFDFVVMNKPENIASDNASVTIIDAKAQIKTISSRKINVAKQIISQIETIQQTRNTRRHHESR